MRLVVTLIILVAAAGTCAAATVRLSDSVVVSEAKVTLGDIAVIETPNDAERAKLAGVVVAYVLDETSQLRVDSQNVRAALSGAGVNVASVDFRGAAMVCVKRSSANSPAAVVAAIERYLDAQKNRCRFSLCDVVFDVAGRENMQLSVTAAYPRELDGRVRFDLADAAAPGTTVGHAYATVVRTAPVLVTRRRIFGGSVLTADDVAVEYRPARQAAGAAGDASDAVGKRTLATLEAGRLITQDLLQPDRVVKRGDEVTLEYRVTGSDGAEKMRITVRTQALEDAALGDVARLKRIGGRGELLGTIVGRGRAVQANGGVQ